MNLQGPPGKATIIIGFAESLSAPEVAWSLVDAGFEVIAFCRHGRKSGLRASRRVRCFEIPAPERDIAGCASSLESYIRGIAGAAPFQGLGLMPLDDPAVWMTSRLQLDGHAVVVGASPEAAAIAIDKSRQVALARDSGFRVPETRIISKRRDLANESVTFPVVLKPASAVVLKKGCLQKGPTSICANPSELEAALRLWAESEPMLLQTWIPGTGEGLFGMATSQGVTAWTAHRRVRMMNPHGSGASACMSVSLPETVKPAAEKFLREIGWKGLFMFELLRDHRDQLWFVEFNGRPWGSMALARRLGYEYPAWAARAALGLSNGVRLPSDQVTPQALVCRHLGREVLHMLFVARGANSKALADWPSVWRAGWDIIRVGPDDRWYNWRADDWRVFVWDFFRTLQDAFIRRRS